VTTATDEPSVRCGALLFMADRVEKLRGEQPIRIEPRQGVARVRLYRGFAADYPVVEAVWAIGMTAIGLYLLRPAWAAASSSLFMMGMGCFVFAAWMVHHLTRRATIAALETNEGTIKLSAETDLTPDEMLVVRKAICDELNWPMSFAL